MVSPEDDGLTKVISVDGVFSSPWSEIPSKGLKLYHKVCIPQVGELVPNLAHDM